jgi:uncharacterized protein
MASIHYALVTGASSGIGKAIAEEFAKRNVNVLLVALPFTGTFEVARILQEKYAVKTSAYEIDLSDISSVNSVFDWCMTNNFEIRYLVNNAGFGNLSSLEDTDQAVIVNMLLLNNYALVMLTQLFLTELKGRNHAFILNVGSLAAFIPIPNKSVYAATKSFVYTFSSSLYLELKEQGVHVACLCPGATNTNVENQRRTSRVLKSSKLFTQSPAEVAFEGVEKLLQKKRLIIPGWHNKLTFFLLKVLPKNLVELIVLSLFSTGPGKTEKVISTKPAFTLDLR